MDTTASVFISYRSVDREIAAKIHRRLEVNGIRAWWDRVELSGGVSWYDRIRHASDRARIVLPVLTPDWRNSEWTRFETFGAEFVIPLLCSGNRNDVVPGPLKDIHLFDFRNLEEADFDGLIFEIRQRLLHPPATRKSRLINLPFLPSRHFVGRQELLLQLHERFWEGPTASLSHCFPQVVYGPGGIGKTTVAREYIERFWRSYGDVLWLYAGKQTLVSELSELGVLLGVYESSSGDVAVDARRTIRFLESEESRLLVLDNVEDENSIQAWLPKYGGCRVLMTSRYKRWSDTITEVSIPPLEASAATRLLLLRSQTKDSETNQQAASNLAEELGWLPLALEQAAAFMRSHHVPLIEYLESYEASRRQFLSHHSLGSTQYPDSVSGTWWASFSKIEGDAGKALYFASILGPDRIPLRLFQFGLSDPNGSPWEPLDMMSTRMTLSTLSDYSMIKLSEHHVSIHRLHRFVTLDSMSAEERQGWCCWVSTCLQAVLLEVLASSKNETTAMAGIGNYTQHVEALIESEEFVHGAPEVISNVLQIVGNWLLFESSEHRRARPILDLFLRLARSPEVDESILGHGLPGMASAVWYEGNYQLALELAEEAYEIASRLSLEPRTEARIADVLGCIYNDLGDYTKSEDVFEKGLEYCDHFLAKDDPARGWLLNEKAWLYRDMGRYEESESLYLQRLTEDASNQKTSSSFGITNNNIAYLYEIWDRPDDAERHNKVALETIEITIGKENKYYAHALNVCGDILRKRGKLQQALEKLETSLKIQRLAVAEIHPHTAMILWSLSQTQLAAGNTEEAKRHAENSLRIREKLFSRPHPKIASCLKLLASIHGVLDDLEKSSQLRHEAAEMINHHKQREAEVKTDNRKGLF